MILKQYYLGCLAHASYLIADQARGVAAVVDPQRDVAQYMADTTGASHVDHCLDPACGTGVFLRAAQGRGDPEVIVVLLPIRNSGDLFADKSVQFEAFSGGFQLRALGLKRAPVFVGAVSIA